MATDNIVANAGAGGSTIRSFSDGSIEWPVGVCCYITGGSAGAWTLQQVDATHGLPTNLYSVGGTAFALGQALAAASLPVVLTAAQITTLTPPAAITGFATETTLAGVLTTSAFDSKTGALTETAPATDTASSGLNGRLQRIAQRITSLIGLLPSALSNGFFKVSLQESSVSQAVTGAFYQATQPVSGTFYQATQPVSGTVTAAQATASSLNATVVGTGTFVVQATLAAETTKVIGTVNISAAQTIGIAAGSAVIGHVILDTTSTTAVTQATGTNLHMVVDSGTVTTVTTVTTCSTVTNLSQLGGVAISMGTGTRGTGVQRITICTDDVVPASQSGTWTVQPGNTANTTAWLTTQTAGTAGGASVYSFLSTAAVQAAAVKASAGQVYSLHFFNIAATAAYVRLYNMTTTPGTGDAVVYRAMIPGNTAAAGFVVPIPTGLAFSTGIGIRVSGAVADSDNTALAANVVMGNVFYK